MSRNKQKFMAMFVMIALLAGILAVSGGCLNKPAPKPIPDTPNDPSGLNRILMPGGLPFVQNSARMIIGYYENPWPGTPEHTGSFPSMKTFYNSMSAVAPFWYRADEQGNLDAKDSKLVYDTARQLGLKMFPLITNKPEATETLLNDAAIRTKTTDNIVKLLQEKQFEGINIDFELLPVKYRANLTAFMVELYPKVKALNKTVIISVFPQVDVGEDVSGAYDYKELGNNSDYLQIMTYDNHWSTSKPGPISDISWFEKNVKYAIDQVGANKVIIGVSAYGYDWPAKEGEAAETVRYVDAITRAQKQGATIEYDATAQAPHFKYDGHEVWFENDKSTAAKLDILAKYQPAGIAIWRIGQEQPEIWSLIDQKFPKQK